MTGSQSKVLANSSMYHRTWAEYFFFFLNDIVFRLKDIIMRIHTQQEGETNMLVGPKTQKGGDKTNLTSGLPVMFLIKENAQIPTATPVAANNGYT